jgi:hypothetical protein
VSNTTDNGTEPRVLGTLPKTRDGVLIGHNPGCLWFIDRHAGKDYSTGKYHSAVKQATWNEEEQGWRFWDRDGYQEVCWPSECYSTHAAAEAAKNARDAKPRE